MRGVSLPQEPVFSLIKSDFVLGWKNIITEEFVGESHGYTTSQTSVGTTNGAGGRNVQLFVISPDGIVLHALTGFWHPEDLTHELKLAQKLHGIWKDDGLTYAQKDAKFVALQLNEAKNAPKNLQMRSAWQGFDAANEGKRLTQKGVERDTFVRDAEGKIAYYDTRRGKMPKVKPVNVVVHERMAKRPFIPFCVFDVFEFADYGRTYYDNNKKVDGSGVTFMTPKKVARKNAKEARLLVGYLRGLENKARRELQAETRRKRTAEKKAKRKKTQSYE